MGFVIVGTAGHVDHGKTVLVRALAGVDTDRLKEEKERGISIELGFAPLTLPNGQTVGLVDVPGHERFIRQMLAGAGGIDLVMLVIAADEGVMPQTREHLAIIDLLQVQRGIIVLTKTDLVEEEWLELVEEDVRQAVTGSVLQDAPMVAVSAVSGQGLDHLLALLAEQAEAVNPRESNGPARLPIDRVFTMKGFGTIITGTLWSGTLKQEQVAEIMPQGIAARVRQMQIHNRQVKQAFAGQRVACNLAGVEVSQIPRGSVLTQTGAFRPTRRLDVRLKLLSSVAMEVRHLQRVRFYLGTAEVMGRVMLLDRDKLQPGEEALAQLALEESVVAARFDRFVLRSYSPITTIGGGLIFDPYALKHKRHRESVMAELETKLAATPEERVLQLLEKKSSGLSTSKLSLLTGLEPEEIENVIGELTNAKQVLAINFEGGKYLVTSVQVSEWLENAKKIIGEYHRTYPLRRGIPREELRSRRFPNLPPRVFYALLEHWQKAQELQDSGGQVALYGYHPIPSTKQKQMVQAITVAFQQAKWQPPTMSEFLRSLKLTDEEGQELVHFLVQEGKLDRIAEDLYFSREALDQAKEKVAALIRSNGGIELGAVRDALDSSRKFVLPLLEYLDQTRFTRRVGDKRVLFGER